MLAYLKQFQIEQEDERDVLTGLKLLRLKCLNQLEAAQAPQIIDSDITDYFKLKAERLTQRINALEYKLINQTFDNWLIKAKINNVAELNAANHKEVTNG